MNIPTVLRARGYRLYTEGGRRLVDLWLNGGAAILGHTPANMLRELKNTASRGLYAPYPHFTQGRLLKALLKLFPGHSFRLYAAPPAELPEKIELWRPYSKADKTPALFIPVLPGIQTWRNNLPLGMCIIAAKDESLLSGLPESDKLSPILLAMAARGIHDIIAAPERAKLNLPRITKALKNSIWQQQGIYLTLKEAIAPEKWENLFNKFLEAGFLLPPAQSHPLILPGELSDGEEAKLANMLAKQLTD